MLLAPSIVTSFTTSTNAGASISMNLPSLHPAISAFHLASAQPSLLRTAAIPVALFAAASSSGGGDIGSDSFFEKETNNNNNASSSTTTSSSTNDHQENTKASTETETASTTKMDQIKQVMTVPRPKAILLMTIAMALHFGGFEFVRSGMTALFTSNDVGFSNTGAFSLAMGMVSPFSILLLMGYGTIIQQKGPRAALKQTTLFSAVALGGSAIALQVLRNAMTATTSATSPLHIASQAIVAFAFVYQNAYAHLLYTQQWSFLSSVMSPNEGSVWFAAIAGVSSIFSTLTGAMVKPIVNGVGLIGLVACTSLTLILSMFAGDQAYKLSEEHGFDPAAAIRKKQKEKEQKQQQQSQTQDNNHEDSSSKSLVWKAKDLFQRVPTLGFLFGEVLTFQALSVILNLAMITQLKNTIPGDAARAAWLGSFFSATNAFSGFLQFVVIPSTMKRIEPAAIWRFMPLMPFACSLFQSFQGMSPSLWILALSFFATKTMDYSIRGVVNEMVYQPLDFDSRYLGKEIIGVFGSRFGKSGVSLILSGMTYLFPAFGIYHLSKLSVMASAGWLSTCLALSKLVPKKAEAQESFLKQQQQNNSQEETSSDEETSSASAAELKEEVKKEQ